MPYVSVVIPAYNAADFIVDAYRSVVTQTLNDWEIIFVNDGSGDATLSVVKLLAAADPRIKVINLPSNSGPARARNAAIAIAEGDWIAMLDADDRYSQNRLESLTEAAERTGADIILDNQFIVDPILRRTAFLAFDPPKNYLTHLRYEDFLRNIQPNTLFDFGYLQPVIRRSWLVANGINYQEGLRLGEDRMLLLECYARNAKVILVSKPYYHYYFQYSQLTRSNSPTSRTKPNYEPLLAAMQQFLENQHSSQSQMENKLFATACEAVREAMTVATLRTCLRRRDVKGLISSCRQPIRLLKGIYYAKRRGFLLRRRIERAGSLTEP